MNMARRATRFTGIGDALAIISRKAAGGRLAALRSVSARMYVAEAPTKAIPASLPLSTPEAKVLSPTPAPVAKPEATGASPKPATAPANATTPKPPMTNSAADLLTRICQLPEARERMGAALLLVASGASESTIKAQLKYERTDRQAQITRTWDEAVASVCGSRDIRATTAHLADPWDRAIASICGAKAIEGKETKSTDPARARMLDVLMSDAFDGREADAVKLLTKSALSNASADDIAEILATMPKLVLSVDGKRVQQAAASASNHGWEAIHSEIRERRATKSGAIWEKAIASVLGTGARQ